MTDCKLRLKNLVQHSILLYIYLHKNNTEYVTILINHKQLFISITSGRKSLFGKTQISHNRPVIGNKNISFYFIINTVRFYH